MAVFLVLPSAPLGCSHLNFADRPARRFAYLPSVPRCAVLRPPQPYQERVAAMGHGHPANDAGASDGLKTESPVAQFSASVGCMERMLTPGAKF